MDACLLLQSAVVGCNGGDPSFLLCVGRQWVWFVATKGEELRCWFTGAGGQEDSVHRMDPDRVWMLNFDLCYVNQIF